MEQIGIILLIVVFSAVRALVRRARRAGTVETTKPRRPPIVPRWLGRLKQEFEAAARGGERRTPPEPGRPQDLWTDLFGAGSTRGPEAAPPPWETDDVPFREEKPPRPSPETGRRAPEPATHPSPASPRQLLEAAVLDPSRLRQAVVWSEILAPPVALRDAKPF